MGRRSDRSFWDRIKEAGKFIFKIRSLLLALPVVGASVVLAVLNISRLPDQVGIAMLASGDFQFYIDKTVAVLGPAAITLLCLLLMFCSKKVFYPWLISLLSLLLPLMLWLTNVFPA